MAPAEIISQRNNPYCDLLQIVIKDSKTNKMNKTILGLDLGTNSIGWALVEVDENKAPYKIIDMGSRIIPMGAELNKFERGQAQTKNATRRLARGSRKLNKRYKQRRNKLIYVLQQLGMLPSQFKLSSEFNDPNKIQKVCILPIQTKQKQYSAIDLLEVRKKALTEQITLEEFGRIIYLFNQLRGYAGGGIEPDKEIEVDNEDEKKQDNGTKYYTVFGKIKELHDPEIITIKGKQISKRGIILETEDGLIEGETYLDILVVGESLELQIQQRKSKKGITIVVKLPNKTSWRKKMENLEKEIKEKSRIVGKEVFLSEYFLDILKDNKWSKIRNNVILRSRYISEFNAIWEEQSKHYPFLTNTEAEKISQILSFIFPGTKESQIQLRKQGLEKGLLYIIRDQIIYYQRELKDQSDLISNCRFEKDNKVAPKSHPVFQEYKIWEQINKLTINTKIEEGHNRKGEIKYKYEDRPIPTQLKEWLFSELWQKKEITFSTVLNKLKKEYTLRDNIDFLNGLNPKAKLRGNETYLILKKSLSSFWEILGLNDITRQIELWDILYNERGNEYDINSVRTSKVITFIKKYGDSIPDPEKVAIDISKIKFSRDYSSLSLKALDKVLPIVRAGRYFNPMLSKELNEKLIKLLNETVTDPFEKAAQDYIENNIELLSDGGIMNAYAFILVYNRHTADQFKIADLLKHYTDIKRLSQGELRNPLVEQIINETLYIVKDIWRHFGTRPNEIKVELSRDLKNNAERRAKIYTRNRENQKANEEVKSRLVSLRQEISLANIEKYKLWLSQENLEEKYVSQYKDPSKSEIEKMRLWDEQGHISPYTGQPIPLSELFNRERYDIDHIIPQSRYFDDSFTNKVICEKTINKEKGNKTAMEYFENGSIFSYTLSKTSYIDHINRSFTGLKRTNLLATKVPEDPIARQLKETQYISVRAKEELSKIVGSENIKTSTGSVTDYLRNQWGLTEKFKQLLKHRYEKMQPILAEIAYAKYAEKSTEWVSDGNPKNITNEPKIEKEQFIATFNNNFIKKKGSKLIIKDWSKRIDHRHHAIDALVVACTKPSHIKRLNDLNKELQSWLDKNRTTILPDFNGSPSDLLDEILNLDSDKREKIFMQMESFRRIELPWQGFPDDANKKIKELIVSQKPKDKLLIQKSKAGDIQIKIRGQLHESTLYGKSQGFETYRIPLTKLAEKNLATEKTIKKIVNTYLRREIESHLGEYKTKEDAFSIEGIIDLNKKLSNKKNKKGNLAPHTPITSVKIYYRDPEKVKSKKESDTTEDALQKLDRAKSFNQSLYVSTGGNYLFAVLEKEGKRMFDLISLYDATIFLKDEFTKASNKTNFDKNSVFKKYFEEKNSAKLLFTLKQGDPVYMPLKDEEIILNTESELYEKFWKDKEERSNQIHWVVKFSKKQIYFINHYVADSIVNGSEFGSQNCYEKIHESSIKDYCIKLSIDRLGNIKPI